MLPSLVVVAAENAHYGTDHRLKWNKFDALGDASLRVADDLWAAIKVTAEQERWSINLRLSRKFAG